MPRMSGFGMADLGLVRKTNEDRWIIDLELGVAIVADGMGGAACGEVAAMITIEETIRYMRGADSGLLREQIAKQAIRAANQRVRKEAEGTAKCRGMGSTIVMVVWQAPILVVANVGDSRAYLWRAGELRQISYDQTLQNQLRLSASFTEEQLRHMGHKNVLTMAIGTSNEVLIQTREERLELGDQILICSDGLWGGVADSDIALALARRQPLRESVQFLIEKAREAGGHDNISVVLLEYDEAPLN